MQYLLACSFLQGGISPAGILTHNDKRNENHQRTLVIIWGCGENSGEQPSQHFWSLRISLHNNFRFMLIRGRLVTVDHRDVSVALQSAQ
jgi:hypothetical protein